MESRMDEGRRDVNERLDVGPNAELDAKDGLFSGPQDSARKVLKSEDLYRFRNVGDAQVSPDGSKVLFVVSQADEKTDANLTNIWIACADTREVRRFTSSGKDRAPRWSPDGRRFAFVSNRLGKSQIWIAEMDGGEPWQLQTKEAVDGAPVWSPDGKHIAFSSKNFAKDDDWVPYPGAPRWDRQRAEIQVQEVLDGTLGRGGKVAKGEKDMVEPLGIKSDVKVATEFLYRFDGAGHRGDLTTHLFMVDVPVLAPETPSACGKARQLTEGDYNHQNPVFSKDGKYLLVTCVREKDADYLDKQDFWLVRTDNGRMIKLMNGLGAARMPVWSPDGTKLAFVGHDNSHAGSTTPALWVLEVGSFIEALDSSQGSVEPEPLSTSDGRNLTKELDRPIGNMAPSDVSYFSWTAPYFWEDQETILFLACDKGATGIFRAHLLEDDCTIERVWHDPNQTVSSISRAGDSGDASKTTVIQLGSPSKTNDLYLFREHSEPGKEFTLLTDLNRWLSEYVLGRCERFTYKGDQDWDIDGWLLYPVDYEKGQDYPTVLFIHGGPHGAYGSAFQFQGQVFANQGYAVLYTNPRGSHTYGQEFAFACTKDWGGGDYRDIMAGVDHVISMGVADPVNLFVTGWSYGGYMSSWVVTQTNRFKAAVAGAIISNLYSMYGTGDIPKYDEPQWGGPPWEQHELYFKMSPIHYVEKVETPVLLIHGEKDIRCPTSQSEEFYLSLKRLKKTAVFVTYPGEFHGFVKPLHKFDRYERTLSWFDYYKSL